MANLESALIQSLKQGVASAATLGQTLGVSQPTLSGALRALERAGHVVRTSATRGARYGLRRPVGTVGSEWPVNQVDGQGKIRELGRLYALHREQYFFKSALPALQGLSDGLPYFLQDARPAGFLGGAVPRAFPELQLPDRVVDWSDDHVISFLTQRGTDTIGDLITGGAALDRYLQSVAGRPSAQLSDRPIVYPAMASAAMAGTPAGSSAHGEQPKFTVPLQDGDRVVHMLVKFSPPRGTVLGQRWSDLLVAEHVAHEQLREQGINACDSRVLEFADRTFLEVRRFDRVGSEGRRGVVSLQALGTAHDGQLDNWIAAAQRLGALRLISQDDVARIRLLSAYGELIGNTDRHFGNLSFYDRYDATFSLAPVYDMLPMLFAPQSDQIIARQLQPAPPSAATLPVWPRARQMAESYWDRLRKHERISKDFIQISEHSLRALQGLPRAGAFAAH